MKKWLVFILWSSFVYGQIKEPVIWETSVISDSIKNIYTIRLKANIEKNWHLYSQFSDPNGAIPTEFKFKKNKGYRLIGRVNETEPTVAYDEVFEMDLSYFNEKAIFTQKIEIFDTNLNKIEAEVTLALLDFIVSAPFPPEAKSPYFLKLCSFLPSRANPEFKYSASSSTDLIPSPGSSVAEVNVNELPSDKFIVIFEKPLI